MPLYAVSALFSLFASVYSIVYIPFDTRVVQWHFWLSLGSVIWCLIGQIALYFTLRSDTTQLGVAGQALALSFVATIPVFLAAQALVRLRTGARPGLDASAIARQAVDDLSYALQRPIFRNPTLHSRAGVQIVPSLRD